MSSGDDAFRAAARAGGRIPDGRYRVVTREADGRLRATESPSFEAAVAYADDAASEGGPLSRVYDARLRVVYRGRHYLANSLIAHHARTLGPLAPGAFRVVVVDSDPVGREGVGASHRDFPSLPEAAAFADAQAALSEDEPPVALVFDAALKPVHVGVRRD